MANGFLFDSEQPGFQAPQPTSQGGGGQGLLNVLGSIGSGLLTGLQTVGRGAQALSAGYQAGRGNIGPLMFMQQQQQMQQQAEQRQNLMNQLQSFAEQADPQVKNLIQDQLKFGQAEDALKTAANASTFSTFKEGLKTSRLSSDLKGTLGNIYLTNPNKAVDMLRSLEIVESQMGAAREKEAARAATQDAKKLINRVIEGFDKGILKGDDPELATKIGSIAAEDGKVVSPEAIRLMMQNPKLKGRLKDQPVGFWSGLAERAVQFFKGAPQQAPAPTPETPAAPAQRKRFNPQTGQLE